MQISEHLSIAEIIKSESAKRLGISNMPTSEHIANFKILAEKVFEPIRKHFGVPIHISSGYRSKELNAKIKGSSKTSDHCFGRAIDIDQDGSELSNNEVFHWIKDNLQFKQLIAEYPVDGKLGWVHVSFDPRNIKNEVLICVGKYLPYKGNEHLIK